MILGILGPPDCGKSALAEALCRHANRGLRQRPLYLTTLPLAKVHARRIARHQRRRGPRWLVRDLNLPAADLLAVLRRLNRQRRCVLLDGVIPLLVKQMVVYNRSEHELQTFASALLGVLGDRHSRCAWIIVDTTQPDAHDPSGLTLLLSKFHKGLAALGTILEFDER